MKYLILSLLLLSSTLMAKPFNANLLVGKWQCFVKFDDTHLKGTERISVEYRSDGTYTTKSVLNTTIQNVDFELKNPKSLMEITAIGQWQINKNIYFKSSNKNKHPNECLFFALLWYYFSLLLDKLLAILTNSTNSALKPCSSLPILS